MRNAPTRRLRLALAGLAVFTAGGASLVAFRPRPAQLMLTPRAGDDTVVINQTHPTRLSGLLIDQYGRRLRADTTVQYRRIGGDSITLSPSGELRCTDRRDAIVRATFERLSRDFILRCRPVASIEAPTWLDLVVGDSTRDLSFVAHGTDGRVETELRGSVIVPDKSMVSAEGTTIRPIRSGSTAATIQVGNAEARIPIMIYERTESFLGLSRRNGLLAMPVTLTRGDTIEVPLPKAAFWVTYFSRDRTAPPPTIELKGNGSCAQGDGVRLRRIEEGEYAKYCLTGNGARLMIAHGAGGAERVTGIVALRLM